MSARSAGFLILTLLATLAPAQPAGARAASDIAWSTFAGGALVERITGVAVNGAGAVYIAGFTNSSDLPTTPGTFQPRRRGEMEAFVGKIAPDGRSLVYLTYFGGADFDIANAIAVDAAGAAYIAGRTGSPDLPLTEGAPQPAYRGDFDAFIAKLSPDGSRLAYATFLGGRGFDQLNAIAVDPTGAAVVAGATQSADLAVTADAPQPAYQGELRNALVARLDPDGRRFSAVSYLGGSSDSVALGVAADLRGAAYIVGRTDSTDLATTPGAYQPTAKGGGDAFLVKLSAEGQRLDYATYLGGRGFEQAAGVAVDAAGAAYVTGYTASSDFPISDGAPQPRRRANYDSFILKVAPAGDALIYGSFFGGGGNDQANAIAVDGSGAAIIAGQTESADLPAVKSGAQPLSGGGEWDAFLARMSPDGRAFAYATFLGGPADDQATSVAVGPNGVAVIAGFTRSSGFPTVVPLQRSLNGEQDAFVAAIEPGRAAPPPAPLPPPTVLGDDCQVFAETGQRVCGVFKSYWNARGGLAQFGYPLSAAIGEPGADGTVATVQYFERARFEHHPGHAAADEVLLGLLGRAVTAGREGEPPFLPMPDPGDAAWFLETGHTLRGRFRDRWAATGGLAVYGFPISEEFPERNPEDGRTYTVQYFERNRFEHHPELAGTPHEITLGQLGRQVYERR